MFPFIESVRRLFHSITVSTTARTSAKIMSANGRSSSDRAAAVRRASSGVALWHQLNPEANVGGSTMTAI